MSLIGPLCLVAYLMGVPFGVKGTPVAVKIAIAYAYPPVLGVLCFLVLLLARSTRGRMARWPLVLGWFWVAGGTAFDVTATLVHTPDLSREANLVARTLLDSGHGLAFMYAYGATAQVLALLLFGGVWTAFLRHRNPWMYAAMQTDPRSTFDFVRKALRSSAFWLLVPLFMGLTTHRWHLGLRWFDLVPHGYDAHVLGVGLAVALVAFVTWLAWEYRWRARIPADG